MISAAFSTPSSLMRLALHSLPSNTPIRMWRTLKTARQSWGVHGSGDTPAIRNSTGRLRVVSTKALTPAAYASSIALVSALSTARSASTDGPMPSLRISTSCSTAASPTTSAHRPWDIRRSCSMCQSLSWAVAKPCPKKASWAVPARTWGIPWASLSMVTVPSSPGRLIGLVTSGRVAARSSVERDRSSSE